VALSKNGHVLQFFTRTAHTDTLVDKAASQRSSCCEGIGHGCSMLQPADASSKDLTSPLLHFLQSGKPLSRKGRKETHP
jgi:hypothetical protein